MKKLFTPILILGWMLGNLSAQQAPQYSLYAFNAYAFNPACAGLDNSLVFTGVYRKQWSNLEGAPETQHLNVHLPLYVIRSGIGLRVENDVIGAHRVTQVVGSYNYQMEIGRNALLSMGVSGGYLLYVLDGAKLRAPDGTYAEPGGVFSHNDQYLPEGNIQAGAAVGEAGIYFQSLRFEAGAAVQPVFAPVLKGDGDGNFSLKPERHYIFTAAYRLNAGNNLELRPSMLAKTDAKETQIEISTYMRWRENIFAGASYRGFGSSSRDAAILFAGMKINEKTTLGYAFDLPLSPLKAANRGSHELLLRYNLGRPIGAGKLPPIIYNPRFF